MSEISTSVIVNVSGESSKERKLSVVNYATAGALLALSNAKGDVGKIARNKASNMGLVSIAKSASNANYRPLAEYLAASFGEAIVISNRASFESLPDQMEQRVLKAKAAKSGGYRVDSKSGVSVPNAALSLALTMKAVCTEVIAQADQMFAERMAERAAVSTAVTVA